MTENDIERVHALHPRVSIGNDSPVWLNPRRTIYGVTLDGRYVGVPRCRTWRGALKKAEKLSRTMEAAE